MADSMLLCWSTVRTSTAPSIANSTLKAGTSPQNRLPRLLLSLLDSIHHQPNRHNLRSLRILIRKLNSIKSMERHDASPRLPYRRRTGVALPAAGQDPQIRCRDHHHQPVRRAADSPPGKAPQKRHQIRRAPPLVMGLHPRHQARQSGNNLPGTERLAGLAGVAGTGHIQHCPNDTGSSLRGGSGRDIQWAEVFCW